MIGEATSLTWTDIDFARKIIIFNNPEKNSLPRIKSVSDNLIAILNKLPRDKEHLFGSVTSMKVNFSLQRKRMAYKLGNPRLLKIHFHTFRHWYATMLYHKTKDILYVKQELGHKRIDSTLVYITIEKALFQASCDEFFSAIAHNVEEASKLIESGFEYVCDFDGVKLFRKTKWYLTLRGSF